MNKTNYDRAMRDARKAAHEAKAVRDLARFREAVAKGERSPRVR